MVETKFRNFRNLTPFLTLQVSPQIPKWAKKGKMLTTSQGNGIKVKIRYSD